MNMIVPSLDIRTLVYEQQQARSAVEKDFEKNYRTIAIALSSYFAKESIPEVVSFVKDPYTPLNTRFCSSYNIDITDRYQIDSIQATLKSSDPECVKLPPFNHWLSDVKANPGIQEMMQPVLILTVKKLNGIFTDYTSHYTQDALIIKAELETNAIKISALVDEKKLSESTIEIIRSPTIEKQSQKLSPNKLPTYDLKGLIAEKLKERALMEDNFEKNYKKFAFNIAVYILKKEITAWPELLKNKYTDLSRTIREIHYGCDITDRSTAICVSARIPPLFHQPAPFKDWLNKFSTGTELKAEAKAYYQDFMKRVVLATEKKLNDIFCQYTADPKQNSLKYSISVNSEKLELNVKTWIDLESLQSKVETIPQKSLPLNSIKKTPETCEDKKPIATEKVEVKKTEVTTPAKKDIGSNNPPKATPASKVDYFFGDDF